MKRFVVTIDAYMWDDDDATDVEVKAKAQRMAKILDIEDNQPNVIELGEQPTGTNIYRKIL